MKIIHLSDLHIGKRWFNRDMNEDQKYILHQITEIISGNKPDAVVIAGDIYNTSAPTSDAVELFDYFISELSAKVPDTEIMIISGNHDSTKRIDMFRKILNVHKIHMIGKPPVLPDEYIEKITLTDEYGNINFYLLPFISPAMVNRITGTDENGKNLSYNKAVCMMIERENIDTNERNILVSHQFYMPSGHDPKNAERMESESIKIGNIDVVYADILERFDYCALGHIHKPMKVGSEYIRYCGTPIAYSISEAGQKKGVVMVELNEKGSINTSVIPLEPLRKVRIIKGTFEDVISQGCSDYVSIVLTEKPEVTDVAGKLNEKFPYLLEVHYNYNNRFEKSEKKEADISKSVFELCTEFLQNVSTEEEEILQDIINSIQGGTEK
ncbi:MAG: exonuclease SbcCD subunit D [Prevotella sp.]|nr:exonuclease SbcCD subunit D [Alistipes senegalensis]MCM1358180.1 exonuclease SbcCD subunit D [Prevotella sp.]MCM1474429.1 exonuclease SbcCD subunit D [Muribaculaceae bacterium]